MKYLAQHLTYSECSINAWETKTRSRGLFQAIGIPGAISKVRIYPWLLGKERNCITDLNSWGLCTERGRGLGALGEGTGFPLGSQI